MKTQIVLISGRQGSGKTTLAMELQKVLHRTTSTRVVQLTFAETIYQIHHFALNTLNASGIKTPEKDGLLLQLLGTEWGRKTYGDNIWVDIVRNKINAEADKIKWPQRLVFIISDCRFKNEFDGFPEALRVRLQASESARKGRCPSWRLNTTHPSEIDLDGYEMNGLFDLNFATDDSVNTPNHIAELINKQLLSENWITLREK